MGKIELAYIGEYFYSESGTRMSSLIPVGETEKMRWCWGTIIGALADGHEVSIRPASYEELGKAHLQLREIKDR